MIYSKRANGAQLEALAHYESICGLEPMHQDEFDEGKMTFSELWRLNVVHLFDIYCTVQNINIPFEDEPEEQA